MPAVADRVYETTTTTGTGALALGGAATGYQSFATAFAVGANNIPYVIEDGAGAWEVGFGTLSGGTTLARDTVTASSNAGALVNFAAGTKKVYVSATSGWLRLGRNAALARGLAMK